MRLAEIRARIEACGLSYRGAFHPAVGDVPDRRDIATLVLAGFAGGGNWRHFRDSREAIEGGADSLDRWSLRVVGELARAFGAGALFPFVGPPWLPFQQWARKAEPLHPSPLGLLIHPEWGLWHSWRGALAFREWLELPPPDRGESPCDSCAAKPCLSACPAGAFSPKGYDVPACIAHIETAQGADCMDEGCRARRACPVGAAHRYSPDQAHFHMRAFRAAQRRRAAAAPTPPTPP